MLLIMIIRTIMATTTTTKGENNDKSKDHYDANNCSNNCNKNNIESVNIQLYSPKHKYWNLVPAFIIDGKQISEWDPMRFI